MQLDSYLSQEVLPAATRWLTSIVEVLPVQGNLKLQQRLSSTQLVAGALRGTARSSTRPRSGAYVWRATTGRGMAL